MRNQTVSVLESTPAPDDVREQLRRILSSPDLILPDRGRRFLQFVVTETIEKREGYLKAFTIAQAVFGRGNSFDAQNDPCVRIAARQLRSALERYYLTAGAKDPLLITVPAGGYVAAFTLRGPGSESGIERKPEVGAPATSAGKEQVPVDAQKSEGRLLRWIMVGAALIVLAAVVMASLAEWDNPALKTAVTDGSRPRIVIDRFESVGQGNVANDISAGLTSELFVNLAKFKDVVVMSGNGATGATATDPTYTLQGSVRLEDNDMRSTARLVRQADGVVVWTGDYNVDIKGRSILDIETGIARSIATAIVAPLGAGDHKTPGSSGAGK